MKSLQLSQAGRRRDAAKAAVRAGELVIVVDEENGELRADLVASADAVDGHLLATMIQYSSGLVCAAVTDSRAAQLDLPDMPSASDDDPSRRFSVAVDASDGVTTGISAWDRAHTLRVLAQNDSTPDDLTRPGHVMVLRADPRGRGQAAAALRLCRIAGVAPVAAIAPLMFESDDAVAHLEQVRSLAAVLGAPVVDSADTRWNSVTVGVDGVWSTTAFDPDDVLAGVRAFGRLDSDASPLLGIRGRCLDTEIGGRTTCRCGAELSVWTSAIESNGAGAILVYRDRFERCVDRPLSDVSRMRDNVDSVAGALGIDGYRALASVIEAPVGRRDRSRTVPVLRRVIDPADGWDPYVGHAV